MNPFLSVIVPTYNEEECITRCIEGFRQECEHIGLSWELIVTDDGSSDRTNEIVRELASHDHRVRLVERPHRGKGAAVRQGIKAASGRWLFMADADGSMPFDNLQRFLGMIGRRPVPHVVIG